jgi:hypothetical protein
VLTLPHRPFEPAAAGPGDDLTARACTEHDVSIRRRSETADRGRSIAVSIRARNAGRQRRMCDGIPGARPDLPSSE